MMKLLEKEITGYDNLTYKLEDDNRLWLTDTKLDKKVQFESQDVNILHKKLFHEKLKEKNDFTYENGHGFYLESYAEFGIVGFMDEHPDSPFEVGKRYKVGNIQFEVSSKSDLFHFFTWFEDKSKIESLTLKLYGVTKESYWSEVEKVLFYLGVRFKDEIMDEYGEFFYPRILDVRDSDIPCETFQHTPIQTDLDWSCAATGNLALFNEGEATSSYNFFAYYRFIETFFHEGEAVKELERLLSTIETEQLLEFARETLLIGEDGNEWSLAHALYDVGYQYIHSSRADVIPLSVDNMAKWKIITKEISIQLFNQSCTIHSD